MRRRTGQQGEEGEEEAGGGREREPREGERSRHRFVPISISHRSSHLEGFLTALKLPREFLSSVSWAVDQLTIDPEGEGGAPEAAEPSLPPAPPPAPRLDDRGGAARWDLKRRKTDFIFPSLRVTGPARFLQGRLRGEWGRVGEGENTWGAPMPDR